jgi:hypothetical protein
MRARALILAMVVVAVVTPLLARAEHMAVPDADDVNGGLDIEIVELIGDVEPSFRIETYEGWSERRIFDKGYVFVYFDTFAGARYDYFALVVSTGSDLDAFLMRDRRDKPDLRVGTLAVAHNSRREVVVVVPLDRMRMGASRVSYTWYVATTFTNKVCPRVCIDRVPDEGGVVEPLPLATPSPSPSASPSPSPSASPSPSPSP